MVSSTFVARAIVAAIALGVVSCAAASKNLEPGMTQDQAVQAMGQPDLKDFVPGPSSGAKLSRYTWLTPGKAATFGPDNHIVSIENVSTAAPESPQTTRAAFDPIGTPLNYVFYPLTFGFAWLGAGINCVAEGDCQRPQVPPPGAG
ncbi:MAG: hypothetical protein WA005_13725 [Candidatus Binataceae bacterium]